VQPGEKLGGFSFGIKERFQWYSQFSDELSEILFVGYNADYFTHLILTNGDTILNSNSLPDDTLALIQKGYSAAAKKFSEIMGESRMSLSWYREYNFSYGRQLVSNDDLSLYAGIGVKYLAGMGIMEARVNSGELEAFSAFSPAFPIDYGDSATTSNPSTVNSGGLLPKAVGSGVGFDIGVSVILGEKLKLGAALNDIGSITWDGNVYQASDNELVDLSSSGFESFNFVTEAQKVIGENGVFDWGGVVEKKVSLPTNLRIGASFMPNEKFEAGLDIVIPVNDVAGSYGNALLAFGVDITPIPWLRLSTGASSGGYYGFNLPIGALVMIGEGSWEIGVASRDVITFFTEDRPTLSLSAGFLRFRF